MSNEVDLGNLQVDEPVATLPNMNIPIIKGEKGDTGATGQAGQDGHTPVKGVDYFTSAEIIEFTTIITNNVNQNIGLRLDEINGEVI